MAALRNDLDGLVQHMQSAHAERLVNDVRTVERLANVSLETGNHTVLTAGLTRFRPRGMGIDVHWRSSTVTRSDVRNGTP